MLAIASLSACTSPERHRATATEFLDLPAGEKIGLRVALPRDTVAQGDTHPLEVRYYVINGPGPVRFDNAPKFWSFHVLAANGTEVAWNRLSYPATGASDDGYLVLPARVTLGQVVDLRCIRDDAGYSGDPLAHQECLGSVQLLRRGEYHVIVEYSGPDLLAWPHVTAAEDSATIARPREAAGTLRMADTATLVVTG